MFTVFVSSLPSSFRPCVSLFHRVQSEMGEELWGDRERESERDTAGRGRRWLWGLTGLFMGIDFNLQ